MKTESFKVSVKQNLNLSAQLILSLSHVSVAELGLADLCLGEVGLDSSGRPETAAGLQVFTARPLQPAYRPVVSEPTGTPLLTPGRSNLCCVDEEQRHAENSDWERLAHVYVRFHILPTARLRRRPAPSPVAAVIADVKKQKRAESRHGGAGSLAKQKSKKKKTPQPI